MRTVLIQSDVKGTEEFLEILSTDLIDFKISSCIEEVELSDIEIVIFWLRVPDFLLRLPNLKLLLACGSGIDHIITSSAFPHKTPLIRLVDPFLRNRVSDYVVEQILNHFFPEIDCKSQPETLIGLLKAAERAKPKIGLMGLGLVGFSTAEKLQSIGFEVCGWVKTSKRRSLEEVYVGNAGLKEFANQSEALVCHLPLTNETKDILDSKLFSLLPRGAFLINVGRGAHLVESDLQFALEMGYLSGACLDVFVVEPLPLDHPFHLNPKIKITPHIAGYVGPETQAPYAAQIIADFYENGVANGKVDFNSCY